MTSLLSDQENQIATVTNDNDVIEEPALPEAMPQIIQSSGIPSPAVPSEIKETGIDASLVTELALKLANSVPNLTTPWAAQQICLPMQLRGIVKSCVLEKLRKSGVSCRGISPLQRPDMGTRTRHEQDYDNPTRRSSG